MASGRTRLLHLCNSIKPTPQASTCPQSGKISQLMCKIAQDLHSSYPVHQSTASMTGGAELTLIRGPNVRNVGALHLVRLVVVAHVDRDLLWEEVW